MRFRLVVIFTFCFVYYCKGQDYGYIVTEQDVLLKGYLRTTKRGEQLLSVSITDIRTSETMTYETRDIRYYSLKEDTFQIFKSFYPFEGETYTADVVSAKILIGKGKLRLYYGTFDNYVSGYYLMQVPNQAPLVMKNSRYTTYIIKDREGTLYGIKKGKDEFLKSIEFLIDDDEELIRKIKNGELKFKDMEKIIKLYNSN